MRFQMIRLSWFGWAAMIGATCGYAGAQTKPVIAPTAYMESSPTPNDVQKAPENLKLVSANASLVHSIDSKNAALGQIVTAKLTSKIKNAGSAELPKGTMLIGKVEQVEMSNNSGPSRLSIVFDQARLSNGQTVPIKVTLLGAYPENTADYWVDTTTSGSLLEDQPRYISSDQKIDQEPGVLGHVEMHSAVQSNASAVFVNKDGNVDLKRGTRLQIAIAPAGSEVQGITNGQ